MDRARRIAVALLLTATATACTGTGGEQQAKPAPPERAVIKVGIMPTTGAVPLLIAAGKGFFEEEGLTVEPVVVTGGAAALPQLDSRMLDIAQTDYVSALAAHNMGKDLTIVGGLHQAGPGSFSLVTGADSRIKSPADLKGKKIAVNNLMSMSTLMVTAVLKDAGLKAEDVLLVETPFPEMETRLVKGKADAAWLAEPFVTQGERHRALRRIPDSAEGRLTGLPVGGWAVSGTWARDNPHTLAAFRRALAKTQPLTANGRAEAERTLPTFTKIDRGVAEAAELGVYTTGIDERGLQRIADHMLLHGYVENPLHVKKVLAAG